MKLKFKKDINLTVLEKYGFHKEEDKYIQASEDNENALIVDINTKIIAARVDGVFSETISNNLSFLPFFISLTLFTFWRDNLVEDYL